MLFAVKRDARLAILVACALVFAGWLGRLAMQLPALSQSSSYEELAFVAGIVALMLSDSLVHMASCFFARGWYAPRYRALVEYFCNQTWTAVLAGGALAAAEEWFFRGVVLDGLRDKAGFSTTSALLLSSVVFGLCHLIPRRDLSPFTLWAVWEGILLGLFYVLTESLGMSMLLHALHDIAGFSLFHWQRKTKWLPEA